MGNDDVMLTAARWVTMMSLDSQGVEMKTFHTISSVLCVVAPLKHLDSSLEYFEEEVRTKWRAGRNDIDVSRQHMRILTLSVDRYNSKRGAQKAAANSGYCL